MALTQFQALVSRESHAEVYPNTGSHTGSAAIVVAEFALLGSERVIYEVEVEGEDVLYRPDELDPSDALRRLIDSGAYDESTMTHTCVIGGEKVVTPLSY